MEINLSYMFVYRNLKHKNYQLMIQTSEHYFKESSTKN